MASKQQVVTGSSTKSEIVPQVSIVPTSYWCLSKAEIDVDFKWTIERLAFFAEREILESFTSTEIESKYSLKLDFDKIYVTIYFLSSKLPYPLRVEITIFNEKSEIISRKFKKCIPSNIQSPVFLYSTERTNLKSGRCVSGNVTISCKVESINKNQLMGKETTTVDETRVIIDQQDRILHQLEEMFNNMLLSDVTFNIRGRKFAAHKAILAIRSPVFAGMFHHPTREMQSNQVEVKDIDPDVFQEILRFIYTGRMQSTAMNKMAPGLLAAADKYLLEDLKSCCETHLIRQMSAENCLELLSLTIHHPAEHLKKYALQYFRRCPGDVMKTESDVTFNIRGRKFAAHKAILAIRSPVFAGMFHHPTRKQKTENWKKMKEENLAELFDLQQMVLSTAETV